MAEQLANLDKGVVGKLITATYPTTSVPNSTYTTIGTINLKANHTYIICASHQYSTAAANVATVARLQLDNSNKAIYRTANGMYNGGGISLSAIVNVASDSAINFDAWQGSGNTQKVASVNMNAYQLD